MQQSIALLNPSKAIVSRQLLCGSPSERVLRVCAWSSCVSPESLTTCSIAAPLYSPWWSIVSPIGGVSKDRSSPREREQGREEWRKQIEHRNSTGQCRAGSKIVSGQSTGSDVDAPLVDAKMPAFAASAGRASSIGEINVRSTRLDRLLSSMLTCNCPIRTTIFS